MKSNVKKLISCVLAVMMIIAVMPVITFADNAETLVITSLEELQKFAADVNGGNSYEGKTVLLAEDISLGGESGAWTPIGTPGNPFKGTFDGGKHIVSDLYIASGSDVGFFGCVNGGTVKNLIVGGSVSGSSDVGGVVGSLNAGTVLNCGNKAAVRSSGNGVGGVVGYAAGVFTVSGCYNSGTVEGGIGYIGGVAGWLFGSGTLSSSYNTGAVTGMATVGGVAGGYKGSSSVISNCYNIGQVNSKGSANNIGAVVGVTRGSITNCYYLKDSGPNVNHYTYVEVAAAAELEAAVLGPSFMADTDHINNGFPILTWQERVPDVIISTYEQLKAFADSVNSGNDYEGKLVRLDVNVSLGGKASVWTPIGTGKNPFKGVFDGNYHSVNDLYIDSGTNVGLFGYVSSGTVKNLVVSGSVSGSSAVAGVVGYLYDGTVRNCGNKAAVAGGSSVGGVVGYNYNSEGCTVSGCFNSGIVSGTTGYIGGVIGNYWSKGVVENCYNIGSVSGPSAIGGIVGGHARAMCAVSNCYNAGQVSGTGTDICAVVGRMHALGSLADCYYLKGTGADAKNGAAEAAVIDAAVLGGAFAAGVVYPVLAWESMLSTDKPVRPAFAESTELSARLAEYIKAAVNSAKANSGLTPAETLLGNSDYMAGASSTATDWMAFAMGRFGYNDPSDGNYYYLIDDGEGYSEYLQAMRSYIEKTYASNNGILHSAKATEWHRAIAAIAALGGDPLNFGTYNGAAINLIADGSYNCALKNGPGTQGINGWIWGLIALDTGAYEAPAGAKYTRETFITEILKMQLTDGVNGNEYGGWVLGGYGSSSDVDITAMALQALAPYYNDDTVYTYINQNNGKEVSKTVRRCADEALDRLGAMMNGNAGFTSWNTNNVESISQVLVALCSLGIDPAEDSRFVAANGETLLDGMLKFRLSSGGFCHVIGGGWNSMANDQATYALVSYWRLENGMRALYDMRSEWTSEEKAAIEAAVNVIENLPDPSAKDYKAKLKAALESFRAVPESERRYVDNYSFLASAVELVGGEYALDSDAAYVISVSVTKNPNKTAYYEGETFDPAGMVITALYSDGSVKEIADYKISSSGELALTHDTVYITCGILKTSVAITVKEKMPWEGEGTEEKPYLIKTADDLAELYQYVGDKKMQTAGVHFMMTQDINMKNIKDWRGIADGASYRNAGFCGHFDGAGHSVWNLNCSTYHVAGLFGKLGNGALIENLTIASGNIGSLNMFNLGGIAGEVISDASVTIRNCRNYASLSGTWGVGGILGAVADGGYASIENCSNYGEISASYTGGGIIGQVGVNRWKNNGAKADILNCYNVGTVGGKGSWGVGGIVGSFRLGGSAVTCEIQNCYSAGNVSGMVSGAVFGSAAETNVKLTNVYCLNGVNAQENGVFTDGGADEAGTVIGAAAFKTENELKADDMPALLGSAYAKDAQLVNHGYPVLAGQNSLGEEAPIRAGLEISTAEELKAFADRVNAGEDFSNKTVVLTAHVDLSAFADWTPIGSSKYQFNGTFDGQGYVIDNLVSSQGGLFGYVGIDAVIKNVGVASGRIGSENTNLSFVGGIAKWSNGADFINCWNGADIYCSGYSGGIVGTVRDGGESLIQGCYNVGSIYGKDSAVGGIVGHLDTSRAGTSVAVTVKDCYNAGSVFGAYSVAGIVGKVQDGHRIQNCYNIGMIASQNENEAGAIAGDMTSGSEMIRCYYNSDTHSVGVSGGSDTAVPKTAQEMKSEEFLALLGESFKKDPYDRVNGGYPLLCWQATYEADEINQVISKIDAIGPVTLESAGKVNAARSAYDDLDDELKEYVSNLLVLVQAEAELERLKDMPAQTGASFGMEPYAAFALAGVCCLAFLSKKRKIGA